MIITEIKLKNFRNYSGLDIGLSNGINIFTGKNAQGKTNLLEAVYLCCVGKSFRGQDRELILNGNDNAGVFVKALKDCGSMTISIHLSRTENKKILINGIPLLRTGQLLGGINAVYFSPDELKLVKEAPLCRRKFLNVDISQVNKKYFYTLIKYNTVLEQRNSVLKSCSKSLKGMLDVYNEQLSTAGSYIIEQRVHFLQSIAKDIKSIHGTLTGGENLDISYHSSFETGDNIKKNFLNALIKNKERDLKLGYTTTGPHRDDIKIILNGFDVKTYGSQGQQRTCALSLKLSELEYYKNITGEYPVLLLDDVFSELDSDRKNMLIKFCSAVQTIITTTDCIKDIHNNTSSLYSVSNGNVKKI